ncbi:hypothetical protein DOK79_001141 [Enterococcus sp. DIV1094]|uniref:Uncharacterized protein n=1 Tax=Candidatus Enterococcus mangumiae TaxID=2230878 RepID=A0ABZ2SWS0_9ENTE
MHNNSDKDVEIDKLENVFKRLFQKGPVWLYKFAKKAIQVVFKVYRKVQAYRKHRKEAKENPEKKNSKEKDLKEKGILARVRNFFKQKFRSFQRNRAHRRERLLNKDSRSKGILARALNFLRQKFRGLQRSRAEDRERLIEKDPKAKGTLSKAWNFVKRKLVISRDHLTREQGVASTSHGRNSGEKSLLNRSNSAERGGTPDGKPRLSAVTNRASTLARERNELIRGQGLARNSLTKGSPTIART